MELRFTHPDLPRYTQQDFPPYRYLPFQGEDGHPHPRHDPAGHSYHAEEEHLPHFTADDWTTCELYLYGIDLFNHGYWWEAHESLEAVWHAADQQKTLCGRFVQGLIQLAGAQLKRFCQEPRGAESLTQSGVERVSQAEGIYLGVNVVELVAEVRRCLEEDCGEFPRIELHF